MAVDGLTDNRDCAGGFWRHQLAQIPSLFGRLVYVSSLDFAEPVICESHRAAFRQWLQLSRPQRLIDLGNYVRGLDAWTRLILAVWAGQAPLRQLVPPGAGEAERDLLRQDVEWLLAALCAPAAPARIESAAGGWRRPPLAASG